MPRLFVSHASKDEVLVDEFVELLQVGIGVTPQEVFCSSLPGMGIPTGADFVNHIKSQVTSPELVILILTPEFFKSPFCNNEAGATWALSLPIYPIVVPPLTFNDVRGVLAGKQAAKIDDKDSLNDLRDDLIEKLGLTQLRTSHWERKRDKFLAKLPELLESVASAGSPPRETRRTIPPGKAVELSGSWLKLNNHYFESEKVLRPDKERIIVEMATSSAEEEAALDAIRPHHGRGEIVPFAFQNDGGLVHVAKVSSSAHGGKHLWTIELARNTDHQDSLFSEMSVQGHSADEIAEMRAGRLLINDPPPPKKRRDRRIEDSLLEYAIEGSEERGVKIDGCIIQAILRRYHDDPERAAIYARLEAVWRLKAAHIVESVLELSLGPITERGMHVKFRGQRRKRFANEEPETITIEGDCPIS